MVGPLRLDDPEPRYSAVRLCSDLPLRERDFRRENGRWVLHLPPAHRFEGQQRFLEVASTLARERRLSRFIYLAEKPG